MTFRKYKSLAGTSAVNKWGVLLENGVKDDGAKSYYDTSEYTKLECKGRHFG